MTLCSALLVAAMGAPTADEITALPGWAGPLPSKMYSGLINVSAAAGMDIGFVSERAQQKDALAQPSA